MAIRVERLQLGDRLVGMALAHLGPRAHQRDHHQVEAALGQRLNARRRRRPASPLDVLLDHDHRRGGRARIVVQQPLGHLSRLAQLAVVDQRQIGGLQHFDVVGILVGRAAQEPRRRRQVMDALRETAGQKVPGRGVGDAEGRLGLRFGFGGTGLRIGRTRYQRNHRGNCANADHHLLEHLQILTHAADIHVTCPDSSVRRRLREPPSLCSGSGP